LSFISLIFNLDLFTNNDQTSSLSNLSTNEVKALLLRTSEGDENAFAQLFKAYYNLLADYILRITESRQLTQEIVQDVFLKIWINRHSLAAIDCFKAYLLVVARNHAFNCLKQMAREKSRKKEWEHTVLQLALHAEDEPRGKDTGQLIDEAVELLPPQQKNVYILSRREGIPQETIAKKLNISHQTVKKHMVLALRFVRNHLRSNTNLFLLFVTALFRD
jgi:RNA polymerase sigma-70 factor (family 1)